MIWGQDWRVFSDQTTDVEGVESSWLPTNSVILYT